MYINDSSLDLPLIDLSSLRHAKPARIKEAADKPVQIGARARYALFLVLLAGWLIMAVAFLCQFRF